MLDPTVHDTGDFASSSHADFTLGGTLGELRQHHIGSALSIPGPRVGDDDGKVDKFQGSGDQVVVIGDLLNGLVRDVVANKCPARDGAHEFTEFRHERDWLSSCFLSDLSKLLEVGIVNYFLVREVALQRLASEQAVQALPEVNMRFAVQEDPVVGSQ